MSAIQINESAFMTGISPIFQVNEVANGYLLTVNQPATLQINADDAQEQMLSQVIAQLTASATTAALTRQGLSPTEEEAWRRGNDDDDEALLSAQTRQQIQNAAQELVEKLQAANRPVRHLLTPPVQTFAYNSKKELLEAIGALL